MSIKSKWVPDRACLAGLILLTLLWAGYVLHNRTLPQEDAAMLMRYANHVAAGEGIVWNVGAPPVDGATDFLFLIVLAGVVKAGIAVETAVRGIDVIAHVLTVLLVYTTLRRLVKVGIVPAFFSAAYLAVGPSMIYASMGFGTPFFALLAALTWHFAIGLTQHLDRRSCLVFAVSGLGLGLARPEGVLLLLLMLAAVIYLRRGISPLLLQNFLLGFGIPALAYFLWHWHYFGYPLPNPYYIKGRLLHLDSLKASLRNVLTLCFPFFLAWIAGLRSRESLRWAVFLLIPIMGFALIWVLLSNEMNHAWRFQYAVMPLALMSWPLPLSAGFGTDSRWPSWSALSRRERLVWTAVAAIFTICLAVAQTGRNWVLVQGGMEGKYVMARALYPFHAERYTIAVTEAGLLPLYSDWNAIDCWGLNDAWIAHHHRITAGYLDTVQPDVIMFHTGLGWRNPNSGGPPPLPGWEEMVLVLDHYALAHRYVLAGAYSNDPDSIEYYYVKPGCPDAAAIIQQIQHAGRSAYGRSVPVPDAPLGNPL